MALNVGRLGRIVTRGRGFIAEVDGLRFVAISAVVLYHLSQHTLTRLMDGASVLPGERWLTELLDLGHYGVQLFFVLSGFLLVLLSRSGGWALATGRGCVLTICGASRGSSRLILSRWFCYSSAPRYLPVGWPRGGRCGPTCWPAWSISTTSFSTGRTHQPGHLVA